jgi:BirA family biotin operon repressor/biotin-[acetyl-CoA-carboxylase] ligase
VTFGEPLLRYDVVGSTQDIARDLAARGARAGAVVTARFQTHGRGRRGRVWYAPEGANVCLTAIAPPVAAADAWQISPVAGLAVAEGVNEVASVPARVRFPNDVLAGGLKLAGVLVETMPPADGRVVPLIGIGINVNTAEFPPPVRALATSLFRLTGVGHDVASVETALLRRLGALWQEWEQGGLACLLARWKALLDPGARRTFLMDGRPVVCRVLDLAPDGTVTVQAVAGMVCKIPAAAIVLDDASA